MRDHHTSLIDRMIWRIFVKNVSHDLEYDLAVRARQQSTEYAELNMSQAVMFKRPTDLVEFAARKAPSNGLFLEFGIDDGEATNILAVAGPGVVHGFDTLHGLTEDWTGTHHREGAFSRNGKAPRLLSNVRLHTQTLEETLPGFIESHPDRIACLRVNCRTHASTRFVLTTLKERIHAGTILILTNYFNFPFWNQHEFKAFQEFVETDRRSYRYLGFTSTGTSVAVEIL